MKHPLRIVGQEPQPKDRAPASASARINDLTDSTVRPFDLDPPEHVQLRGIRRIAAEELGRAVFERDTETMEFAIRRLHRLGVSRDRIEELVKDAMTGKGARR